jgi:hypothetical protein
MRRLALAACLMALLFAPPASAVVPTIKERIAVVRALDKITARVKELDIPVGQPYKFGRLLITVHACLVTPPEETPESAAFLKVEEFAPGEEDNPGSGGGQEAGATVFRGWMFASSPALAAMQDPVYDIWVTGCKDAAAK